MRRFYTTMLCIVASLFNVSATATPAAGDRYVYRIVNAYNGESRGQVAYRIDNATADRVTMTVSAESASLGPTHIESYTGGGN